MATPLLNALWLFAFPENNAYFKGGQENFLFFSVYFSQSINTNYGNKEDRTQLQKPFAGMTAISLAMFILFSCAPIRHVRPIEKGELVMSAGVGGPFTGQIGWAPFPLISFGANYGVADKIDIEAGFEGTSALFGVLSLEGGCNWRPLAAEGWKPGLIAGAGLLGATDFKANQSRLWPDATLTAVWRLSPKWYYYAGMDNWFETHVTRYDGNVQQYHWLPVIHSGLDFGSPSWHVQLEGILYVPNIDATRHVARTVDIGPQGCLGVFLGTSHSFGKIIK